jgi:CRP-like cAMP-binding protein
MSRKTESGESSDIIKNAICNLIKVNEIELEQLSLIADVRFLERGDTFLAYGQIARYICIIKEGTFRIHRKRANKDITYGFLSEGNVIVPSESLFSQEPSLYTIEALTSSQCICFSYDKLLELSKSIESANRLIISFFKSSLLVQQTIIEPLFESHAKERYIRFCEMFPEVASKVNISHIASFLKMTPETLSRLRSGKY